MCPLCTVAPRGPCAYTALWLYMDDVSTWEMGTRCSTDFYQVDHCVGQHSHAQEIVAKKLKEHPGGTWATDSCGRNGESGEGEKGLSCWSLTSPLA